MKTTSVLLGLACVGLYLNCEVNAGAQPVDLSQEVRSLLNAKCTSCHGGVKRAGGLSFLSLDDAMSKAKSGKLAVKPGDIAGSEMIHRVTSTDKDERMPPADHAAPLDPKEIDLLRRWISNGAPWKSHWAYEAPVAAPLPPVKNSEWAHQDLDRFILARLEAEHLDPSRETDRLAWLRRVTFDLTGLPPTEEDRQAFRDDTSSKAYETVVDRLLASPRYGERWASSWLDLARYADTVGYERDPNRSAWPWRDWVIDAFNDDMPYDEFLVKQLAGDLLPDSTMEDRLATAFHRNTQTNTECGTDDEEFRTIATLDRISTTWEGLMATSFRCVQCHNHPYDPFRQEEFYRFMAIFNSTRDNDSAEDFPHLKVPVRKADWKKADALDTEMSALRKAVYRGGIDLAAKTSWEPLRASSVASNGNATMEAVESNGIPEVHITGVITLGSLFKLEFPSPVERFTALRIQALPFDLAKAASVSELGFVLSYLRMEMVSEGKSTEVKLVGAYDDDPDAFYPAEATMDDDLPGWSAYPRFNRQRQLVLVAQEPLSVPAGALFRLTLQTRAQSTGITSQIVRRSRYAVSGDLEWMDLAKKDQPRLRSLAALKKERDAIQSLAVPVLSEQSSSQRRETRLFNRGNFLDPGATVTAGVPELLGKAVVSNRLDLARWMTRPEHPLTARAAVNRTWEQLFGRGLVESVEDFGSAGQPPSHPALLDWLAVRFSTTLGWSQKRLIREFVLSSTYRQDSTITPDLLRRDPGNRWLSRGPRSRLSAEMVRDQALAVSGLLSFKMGGAPVMPPQPEGIWRTVYNGGKWITSPGEDKYRRAIYTFIRRTSGYPSFLTFDAPSREICTVRRIGTSTPLQALVTLNDPVYIEAANALARQMTSWKGNSETQVRRGYELATGSAPTPEILAPLMALHSTATTTFEKAPSEARALAESREVAALTVVANALLNLDVVLTK